MTTAAGGCGVRVCRTSRARRYCCVSGRARYSRARWSSSVDRRGPVERGVASTRVRSPSTPPLRQEPVQFLPLPDRAEVEAGLADASLGELANCDSLLVIEKSAWR